MLRRILTSSLALLALPAAVLAQAANAPTFTREAGGSIQTKLSDNIIVNKESTLQREWITMHDPAMPADLVGSVGVTTVYKRGSSPYSGEYRYAASYKLQPSQPLRAIEVRFLTFDLWGNHVRTLVATEVSDILTGDPKLLTGEWKVYSENEVSEHYASIAFLSRARTADGRVVEADVRPVLEEARKFSKKLTAADLEPPKPEKK
jgi:hypothetical protein